MEKFWENFLLEIGLFTFLGVVYYFYQKRKIVHYEENKIPIIMNMLLESCLADKTDCPNVDLDALIVNLDDFLQRKLSTPPIQALKKYSQSMLCSPELKNVIEESLKEIGE